MKQYPQAPGHAPGFGSPYTIVAKGSGDGARRGISALVLERGPGIYRARALDSLARAGFDDILCIGRNAASLHGQGGGQGNARYLVPAGESTPGSLVNLGMREMGPGYVLVMWSDMELAHTGLSIRVLERLDSLGLLCAVPARSGPAGSNGVPLVGPGGDEIWEARSAAEFRLRRDFSASALQPSLFPESLCGIYDTARFGVLGGFDESIRDAWWQAVDFGVAAWQAGMEIKSFPSIRLRDPDRDSERDPAVDLSAGKENPASSESYGPLEFACADLPRRESGHGSVLARPSGRRSAGNGFFRFWLRRLSWRNGPGGPAMRRWSIPVALRAGERILPALRERRDFARSLAVRDPGRLHDAAWLAESWRRPRGSA